MFTHIILAMTLKLTCLFSIFFLSLNALAQDGKILRQEPYSFHDTTIHKLEKLLPDIHEILKTVDFYSITYLSDGLKVNGYLSIPKKKTKYPAVIYNRGGNRELGALTDFQIVRMLGTVASWGYVCIGSQYRGNGGSEGREEFGGKDINDVLNLIPCLANVQEADTSRIGMFGWSRGGLMTYLALSKTCNIKAAVIGSGLTDAFGIIKKRADMETVFSELAPGYAQNKDSVLLARSPLYWPEKLCATTPLLLLSGSADWRVTPTEQLDMVRKLYDLKHPVRYTLFEGGDHSLMEHLDEVNHAVKVFLDAYVRDLQKWPSLEVHGN